MNKLTKSIFFLSIIISICIPALSQNKKDFDHHKTILDCDFTFKLHQQAKNKNNQSMNVKNPIDNFFGFRYTNAFFLKEDVSIGFGIGLESAPIVEIPIVLDFRKYFGTNKNRNYMVANIGKTFNGYSKFKTWLGEIGFGRNYKLGEKTSINISANYQYTHLKNGRINNEAENERDWVKKLNTSSLSLKIGFMF